MKRTRIMVLWLVELGVLAGRLMAEGEWKQTGYLQNGRNWHTATLLLSGKVLAAGGYDASRYLSSAEIYSPGTGAWETTGALAEAREYHTATLLPSGKVLVTGGENSIEFLSSAEIYDPSTRAWETTGALAAARKFHTATLLPAGKVLVAGGRNDSSLSSGELYDPSASTWTSTGPLATPRERHTATLLTSGKVLVAGGLDGINSLSSAEIYDSSTGTWTSTGDLTTPRYGHTTTLLPSGKVLVAGGYNESGPLSSAEIYDPSTGTWLSTGALVAARGYHTATLLPSGEVLVAGGEFEELSPLSSAEVYAPSTGTWRTTEPLATTRAHHTATLLPSGKVLVVGGVGYGYLSSAEIYDPSAGTWASSEPLATPRVHHTGTLLPSGKILVAGGSDGGNHSLSSAEIYDPTTGTWGSTGSLATPRKNHTATLLLSGKVLVAGGSDSNNYSLSSAEIYDPSTRTWTNTGALNSVREYHTATLLPSGEVLVAGGRDNYYPYLSSAEIYDPGTGIWTSTGALAIRRVYHTATLLLSGKVLVAGGGNTTYLLSAEVYDPTTGTWENTGSLATPRYWHTATLLPSGKVLLAGGSTGGDSSRAEVYDPKTGTWTPTGSLATPRYRHTATVLPSGEVLVTGGMNASANLSSAELYDPTADTWGNTESLGTSRAWHTATLLFSGKVLVTGGYNGAPLSSGELYDSATDPVLPRPVIQSASPQLRYGQPFLVSGHFRGTSEGSSGNTQSSAVDYPLLQLRTLDGSQHAWLVPDPLATFWDDPMTLTVTNLPPTLHPGPHLLTVITAGVPSQELLTVDLECSVAITAQPADQTVTLGDSATFAVKTQGARWFQWQKDGIDIPGATGPTYTTPPVTAADVGTTYEVMVNSGCTSMVSDPVTLKVGDDKPPTVDVSSPDGGEYLQLSDDEETRTALVTWSMTDNIRICRVEVFLLYSNDGGQSYHEVGGAPLETFGSSGACAYPGEETTRLVYTIPTSPPSGADGSLYKISVHVTDHAGLTTIAESERPFFMINPGGQSVQTLILANPTRMQSTMGISAAEAGDLMTHLHDLAGHPSVQGLVVDLGGITHLDLLYASWDADAGSPEPDPDLANHVLFGCHGDPLLAGCPGELDGIHDVVRVLLDAYPGVKYLILVGDDRIIPMARLKDRTTGFLESHYTSADPGDPHAGLTPGGTTVGQALAADRFLSDDPLAAVGTIRPQDLRQDDNFFLPDLAVGRLVEEPAEIITAIATFISQDGVLDLTALDPETGHKVLVTGYDFLIDSAKKNRGLWKNAFGLSEPHDDDALTPVDGQLICQDWGELTADGRRTALRTHLSGHSLRRYGVMNLNGHATHFEEGVPGADRLDVQGLNAVDVYGSDACVTPSLGALDLAGAVVYAVGCHGGLPVPGSCATDAEHSLDLPQTMLARGVMAYLANTGYGWGLLPGIGVSERLVEIFTEEMTRGHTVAVGELATRTKLRYFLESPRFDAYDVKTSMQWSLYGFPMYAVRTGIAPPAQSSLPDPLSSRKRFERFGAVTVERQLAAARSLPPYLTRLELRFDFTADGVYQKHNASGDKLDGASGCPEPAPGEPEGCYYTLHDLVERATGEADLPIQPYFIYDSRLSGTSQHGVLWMGARYEEETGWVPVIAELVTNGGDLSDHGSLPRKVWRKPRGPRRRILDEEPDCRPSDLEMNSLVLATGEVVKNEESDPQFTVQRLHREVDLEVFYFNNTHDGEGNCDRSGPLFGDRPYHSVTGRTVHWTVPASDEAGVWRVVVVYDDEIQRRWVPVELADAGDGTWTGSVRVDDVERLTYLLQAVDRHGNVSWLEYEPPDPPASGIPLEIPLPLDAVLTPGDADLEVAMTAAPDLVLAGDPLSFMIAVANLGPEPADSVVVSSVLPGGVTYGLAGGTGWSCGEAVGTVTCARDTLDAGPGPEIQLYVNAPAVGGILTTAASVSAANDPNPGNDVATTEVLVVDDTMTDLAVFKEDGGLPAVPGQPITYSITVTNNGPNPVAEALVTDYFPPELHSVTWTCEATVGSFCTQSGNGDVLDPVDLLPQGTLLYKATAIVAEGAALPIENVATVSIPSGMSDFVPGNNAFAVRTGEVIFADGFESGDCTAWSSCPPDLVIVVEDEAPEDASRYVARFSLDPGALAVVESGARILLVEDKAGSKPLLAIGLMGQAGRLSAVAEIWWRDGSRIEMPAVEIAPKLQTIEMEWKADGFEVRLDGVTLWSSSTSEPVGR